MGLVVASRTIGVQLSDRRGETIEISMTFEELLEQAVALLQRRGRLSYRALKRQFDLDDACLEDLTFELTQILAVAADQDNIMLIWVGPTVPPSPPDAPSPPSAPPAPMAAPSLPFLPNASPTSAVEAERRQLTVMFCDLVGSTCLSEQFDPEDLREILLAYQNASAKVIALFGGHIAKYLGDGLLVYFGYPQAHEDDAQRAVRAGLGILEAIERLNPRLEEQWGVRLGLRIGIHTGLVVAGKWALRMCANPWRSSEKPPTFQPGCREWPSPIPL